MSNKEFPNPLHWKEEKAVVEALFDTSIENDVIFSPLFTSSDEWEGGIFKQFLIILNHLSAAQRTLNYHQPGAATLLAYATLERYVDLALWTCFKLDDENPEFSNINLDMNKFHETGMKMYGKEGYKKSEPSGPVGLGLGVQILATLKPDLMPVEFLKSVSKLMQHRNKCEYEHGLCPHTLKEKDVNMHIKGVCKLLCDTLRPMGLNIEKEFGKYRFPDF